MLKNLYRKITGQKKPGQARKEGKKGTTPSEAEEKNCDDDGSVIIDAGHTPHPSKKSG